MHDAKRPVRQVRRRASEGGSGRGETRIPMRHYIEIMRGCLLKGAGFRDVAQQLVSLAVLGSVILAISVARFRRRLAGRQNESLSFSTQPTNAGSVPHWTLSSATPGPGAS